MYPQLGCPTPTPAYKSIPKWWKDMSRFDGYDKDLQRHGGKKLTMRACPAIEDSFFSGYILHLPADVYIDATSKSIEFSFPQFMDAEVSNRELFLQKHPPSVTKGYEGSKDFHEESLKWNPFWGVKTEEGYSTLFAHPFHRQDLPFHSVSGIVDTDKFPTREPFAFFIKKGFAGIIPRGTPMLQLIPFKRDEWEHEIIEYKDIDRRAKISQIHSVFKHPYKKIFWTRKKFN